MEPHIASLHAEVVSGEVPRHVAIIMDGNGRWAQARGEPRLAGHQEGAESVRDITRAARRVGCEALTLYAFSAQNWARPEHEVEGLMDLLQDYLESERDELLENDIRLSAAGDLSRLPARVQVPLAQLRADTAHCQTMVLTLCLSYGGREELWEMTRRIAADVAEGTLDPTTVTPADMVERMWTGDLPEADLILRTSGESRISNFLLWGAAYAELMFIDTPWPEFRTEQFLQALLAFQHRERRFGLTGDQVHGPDGF